jgi:hypothetical protein
MQNLFLDFQEFSRCLYCTYLFPYFRISVFPYFRISVLLYLTVVFEELELELELGTWNPLDCEIIFLREGALQLSCEGEELNII